MLGVKYLFLTVKTKSESSLLKEFKHCKIMSKNLIFQMYAEKNADHTSVIQIGIFSHLSVTTSVSR